MPDMEKDGWMDRGNTIYPFHPSSNGGGITKLIMSYEYVSKAKGPDHLMQGIRSLQKILVHALR